MNKMRRMSFALPILGGILLAFSLSRFPVDMYGQSRLLVFWNYLPFVVMGCTAYYCRRLLLQRYFVLVNTCLVLYASLSYLDAAFWHPNSANLVRYIFTPFYVLTGIIMSFILAMLIKQITEKSGP